MSDQPKEGLHERSRRLAALVRLRSDLRRTAQLQDHLHRVAARLQVWIAVHALLAVASVSALAWYFAQGQCCRQRNREPQTPVAEITTGPEDPKSGKQTPVF